MRSAHKRARTVRAVVVLALIAAAVAASGCYRRVVGARGLGAGGVNVQEPKPPTLLDQLLGPEPQKQDSPTRIRVN